MPTFPKVEAEVFTFSDQMIAGFLSEPIVFPHADVGALQAARAAYLAALHQQQALEGELKSAVEEKQAALGALKACMKRELQRAEADTSTDPTQLSLIGWARRTVHASEIPAQPRRLIAERLDGHVVRLKWRAPRWGEGGRIRSYAIERRNIKENGKFSDWTHVAVALKTNAELHDEPRGVLVEYRVLALNNAGASTASSTASVIV